ncbi:N-acetylserotonin O-methyltransferase-like protein-like protein [Rozella allomycis CSF55]|uniref:Maf-like protein domain-containing protein n=1 Tax=Rozella allomycis (strain CSF55) TaxID=988480 RepID=A0A075AUU4_ROZAC|nr:Maf-like protein domain-containing protein [Rozella allomycis CSF55]RKP21035.1 N-acetylserotonin O-methyltransferase-like protein-like protein [Rozella allomycis CSF55]|eukprot:EPZ32309.1 Maf-like protein domain-containing protein [Rozella allomycis CSF55]
MDIEKLGIRKLSEKPVYLASKSPRRIELLQRLAGFNLVIKPSLFKENLKHSDFETPKGYVLATCEAKANEVLNRIDEAFSLLISADTIVSLNRTIFEKASDRSMAKTMLQSLSGKTHQVYTAVTLMYFVGEELKKHSFVEESSVTFNVLSDSAIEAYLDTNEWQDKAGSYAIQGISSFFIEKINGDFYNIMGFPCCRFLKELTYLFNEQK